MTMSRVCHLQVSGNGGGQGTLEAGCKSGPPPLLGPNILATTQSLQQFHRSQLPSNTVSQLALSLWHLLLGVSGSHLPGLVTASSFSAHQACVHRGRRPTGQ